MGKFVFVRFKFYSKIYMQLNHNSMSLQGANSHGQLGLGHVSELCETPQKLSCLPFDAERLKKIAGGGSHTLLLLDDGRVFGCGWNHKGQLALADTADQPTITELSLDGPSEVCDVACGWDSSAIIDSTGALFVFGSNAFGQLGWPTASLKCTSRLRRMPLPNSASVRYVCFGLRHLAIWTQEGDVYFTGRIKFTAHCTAIEWNGTQWWKLDASRDIRFVSCGQNHFVWAVDDGAGSRVHAIGDNRYGQAEHLTVPVRLRGLLSGWTHNAALLEGRPTILWGRNTYGQLATTQIDSMKSVELRCGECVDMRQLHLGAEHGLAVTDSGCVYTWGWNEHGNCGNGSVHDV